MFKDIELKLKNKKAIESESVDRISQRSPTNQERKVWNWQKSEKAADPKNDIAKWA